MTTRQIEAALNAEAARLDRAETNLREVRGRAPTYEGPNADAIRETLAAEYEPVLSEAEKNAVTAASIAQGNIDIVLNQLTASRPALDAAEEARAANRREFVREDVEQESIGELIKNLQHVLMVENKVDLFLYARYLPKRLEAPASDSWSDTTSSDDVETLRRLLQEAKGRLRDTKLDPVAKRAADIRGRAFRIEADAGKRARADQTFAFQSAGEIKW
jgi:hypothetical protein